MSFRKRNVRLDESGSIIPGTTKLRHGSNSERLSASASRRLPTSTPGLRPSALDGRLTTSTGSATLDGLLAGHGGLALGTSLVLEENGTTDFAGTLLRYYAAEGLVQGHQVHVAGVDAHWGRSLPGLVGVADAVRGEEGKPDVSNERMKIAWRYERLGDFGTGIAKDRAQQHMSDGSLAQPVTSAPPDMITTPAAFCHVFDLSKHLDLSSASLLNIIPPPASSLQISPFQEILRNLKHQLCSHTSTTVHRLVIPMLLSPELYPAHASNPRHILRFLHSLRGLLRRYPLQLTAMITIPLEAYSRHGGIVRWIELLNDGVLELSPFPHRLEYAVFQTKGGPTSAQEEQPQGILKIHRLPVIHEKGGCGGSSSGLGDDLAFTLSRRKFSIKPFSLPPVEGDTDAQHGNVEQGAEKPTNLVLDF